MSYVRSGALINLGVTVAKKNPVIVSSYVVGLLLCLFFSGISLTLDQRAGFEKDLSAIDYVSLDEATTRYEVAYERYRHSQGFFSCDERCQGHKRVMEEHKREMMELQAQADAQMSDAKSKLGSPSLSITCHSHYLGIFSEVGVGETRDLFWTRFGQGPSLLHVPIPAALFPSLMCSLPCPPYHSLSSQERTSPLDKPNGMRCSWECAPWEEMRTFSPISCSSSSG
jgi:hypothetical protein